MTVQKRARILCRGHAEIRATHGKTLEFSSDPEISMRGTCVVGVDALEDREALAVLRGLVSITVRVGDCEDRLNARISPYFKPGDPLIIRTHERPQSRTLAYAATKSALDLDRELVALLQTPDVEIEIIIEACEDALPALGTLYVVAMPIGCETDISSRALTTLMQVDRIFAEDTRTAKSFLRLHGIKTPLISCHDHNERQRAGYAARLLKEGERLALISEAGTPLCSDPGYAVVKEAVEVGALVTAVPGPSSVMSALSIAGLASDRFAFMGFVPREKSKRQQFLEDLVQFHLTTIFFETPHRLQEMLLVLASLAPERRLFIGRNLTKYHEESFRGTVISLSEQFQNIDPVRGEFVLVLEKPARGDMTANDQGLLEGEEGQVLLSRLLEEGVPIKMLAKTVSEIKKVPRREVYQALLALKRG
ncbi:16S rRNA (cytidine(1402)-2'-O)-methyltransferase [Magnetococcales bacterium HHB-1]